MKLKKQYFMRPGFREQWESWDAYLAARDLNPIRSFRAGDYIVSNCLNCSYQVSRFHIYRNPTTRIIIAQMHTVDKLEIDNTETAAVLVIYPDKTKHFIKGMTVEEAYYKYIQI